MHLNPYGEYAVLLAQSLANDWPTDRAGIVERTREHGMTMTFARRPDDHLECREVIDAWLAIVDEPTPDRRAALLNVRMAINAAYPRITDHNGEGWHLHYRDADDSLARVLDAVISVGTALHLTTRGTHRLSRCASPPCTRVIADVTRQGRQRFCSTRCSNRAAVRRHRERPATI